MTSLIYHVLAWPTFFLALLVFGFAPGAALRLIVLAYKREDPRRQELRGELCHIPRIERPFWVAEQLETALFDGLRGRLATWRAERPFPALVYILDPKQDKVLTLELTLTAEFKRPDVQLDGLYGGLSRAISRFHLMDSAKSKQRASELTLETLQALQVHCLVCGAPPEDHHESGHNLWLRRFPNKRSKHCWHELRHRWCHRERSGLSRPPF
jgi:hypothetical protein